MSESRSIQSLASKNTLLRRKERQNSAERVDAEVLAVGKAQAAAFSQFEIITDPHSAHRTSFDGHHGHAKIIKLEIRHAELFHHVQRLKATGERFAAAGADDNHILNPR